MEKIIKFNDGETCKVSIVEGQGLILSEKISMDNMFNLVLTDIDVAEAMNNSMRNLYLINRDRNVNLENISKLPKFIRTCGYDIETDEFIDAEDVINYLCNDAEQYLFIEILMKQQFIKLINGASKIEKKYIVEHIIPDMDYADIYNIIESLDLDDINLQMLDGLKDKIEETFKK